MAYLPLNIDMHQRLALVVGGGSIAARKTRLLLKSGAQVHVVAPELVADIQALVVEDRITCRIGNYELADLTGALLVVAATNDVETNSKIASNAREQGILVAVADAPARGDCIFPAVLRRERLEISVSTAGACPAFAAQIRDLIAGLIDERYGTALEQLAVEREKLLTEGNSSTYNTKIMRSRARELIAQLTERKERVP